MEERILIVDDEEMICLVLVQRLFKERYVCVTANDGREALDHFYKQNFSLIISGECRHIQEHPLIGAKILDGIDFFKDKILMVRHHHEHFDGSGYPDALVGESIPLEARIIAVPDAYDAMTSARPHRSMMPLKNVLSEMERGKGKQFDPKILEIFLNEKIYQWRMEFFRIENRQSQIGNQK